MPKRNLIWIFAVLAAGAVMLVLTRNWHSNGTINMGIGPSDPVAAARREILDRYLGPADDANLQKASVQAMVDSLGDPYTVYFPPGSVTMLSQRLAGKRFGLGLVFEADARGAVVVGAEPGSRSLASGLRQGDRILAVDGKPLAGLTAEQMTDLLDGQPDGPDGEHDKAVLTLAIREGEDDPPAPLAVRRDWLRIQSVQGLYRDDHGHWVHDLPRAADAAYLRVTEFTQDTARDLQSVLRALGDARGLVLDLRGNPGGHLPVAIESADLFVSEGVIATIRTRSAEPERWPARSAGTFPARTAMVVLVDANTASGAELLAGALQYHGRAVVVGWRTMGKGCRQTLLSLGGGLGELNLTTAEFRVDPLEPIQRHPGSDRWGVQPDVQMPAHIRHADRIAGLRRQLWALALPRPSSTTSPSPNGQADEPAWLAEELVRTDAWLAQAAWLLSNPKELNALLTTAAERRDARAKAAEENKTPAKDRP